MSKLYFQNNGAFDARAMTTFGVSVKTGDNAIGFFGTGFKYAAAIILRLGGKISVGTKGEDGKFQIYTFTKKSESIRGKDVDLVLMNGQEIGFTTHLGTNWQPWQAYRELFCNAKDEGGIVGDTLEEFDTTVSVDCQEIYDAWHNREAYFLESKPAFVGAYVDIHRNLSDYFFYQGIAVANVPQSAMFSYNVKSKLKLTEDRTADSKDTIYGYIRSDILYSLQDEEMLRAILGADKNTFEGNIHYPDYYSASEAFLRVCERQIKTGRRLNESARALYVKQRQSQGEYEARDLSALENKMLKKAKEILAKIKITVDDFEIVNVRGMGEGVMGRALKDKIYLSEIPFQMGTKQVASTLMEEWVHLRFECADFDRKMQNWLFDKILSLTEEMTREPI